MQHLGEILLSDAQLVNRIVAGQEEALVEFYARYVNLVFSVALHVLQDHAEAEEVVQDVFLTIWRRAEAYDASRGSITTWLLTIARRRAIDRHRRREARPPSASSLDLPDQAYGIALPKVGELDLHKAMEGLPPEQRECIELIYFGGLSHSEVATRLHVPPGTVKGRVRLAMEKLRRALLVVTGLL